MVMWPIAGGAQDPVATFSILGYDPATAEVGGAVQSRVFSVGNGVLWAEAGVGAAATQAIVDVGYGPKAIELLRAGLRPDAIIKAIWDSDPDPYPDRWTKEGRQFAVIDQQGRTAVYTGPKATTWAGHKQGLYSTAQGNILAGEAVVNDMIAAFEETPGHLSVRLTAALEAGQKAGRRHARHAVGSDPHRRQRTGRLAQQRRGDEAAGRRPSGANQGTEAAGRFVERTTRQGPAAAGDVSATPGRPIAALDPDNLDTPETFEEPRELIRT